MCVNVFRCLFFSIQDFMLSVNTESLFKLSSSLSKLFLLATVTDNCQVGTSTVEIWFQTKWLVKFKEFTIYSVIGTKANVSTICYYLLKLLKNIIFFSN